MRKAEEEESFFRRNRRYGRRTVSRWKNKGVRNSRRVRKPSTSSSSSSYIPPQDADTQSRTNTNYLDSGSQKVYYNPPDWSGCAPFLIIGVVLLPLIIATPLAIIAFPVFVVVGLIIIVIEGSKP